MASENHTPLEELRDLNSRVDATASMAELQPLFARADQIARIHSGDLEVQLLATEVRQRMLAHGALLRERAAQVAAPPPQFAPPAQAPVIQPPVPPPPPPPESAAPARNVPPVPIALAPPKETGASGAPPANPATPAVAKKPRRWAPIGWVAAVLILLIGGYATLRQMQQQRQQAAATTPVDARISTVPPGAQVQIDGQQTCTSDCVARLLPGTYQVTAILDGFLAASSELKIEPQKAAELRLTLAPQPPEVRIVADFAQGQVFLDDQQVGELSEGQWSASDVKPGMHRLRVAGTAAGPNRPEASLSFELAERAMPVLQGPVTAKELLAAVVTRMGPTARLTTSAGPLKLILNGTPHTDATTEGVDLVNYVVGSNLLTLGDGTAQKTISETFDAAAGLTVFLKNDQNIGTLLISTGEDNVRVFVNNKEQKQRTKRGDLRVQTIGKVAVRVEKDGFERPPEQSGTVTKGQVTKMAFKMKELPKVATLQITGATPGAQVYLDQRALGTVGDDGAFQYTNVPPGDHAVELRRDQYEPKRSTRTFRAGQTVTISGAEVTLAAVRVAPPPPPSPPATPKPEPVAPKPPPPPKPVSGGMSAFDNPGAWQQQDGIWRHRGAATLTYSLKPNGIFTFSIYMLRGGTLFRGGRVRWVMNYKDEKNYLLFELDEENFWSRVVQNGKTLERRKVAHKQDKDLRVWNIQVDASAARLIHKIQGDDGWVELDTWAEAGRDFTDGKFGIQVNGSDEVGLSNFQFTGR